MRASVIRWSLALGWAASIGPVWPQPVVTAVVNAASYDPAVPRGCLVSIFGTRLARATTKAASLPLPSKLDDVSVLVGDLELAAPLYFVSANQINAVLPFEALGDTLPLVVSTAEGKSPPFLVKPVPAGPGLFTRDSSGKGQVVAFTQGFQPADSVAPGQPLILYATGLGPTDPPVLSGRAGADQEPLNRVTTMPEVFAGEFPTPAPVTFAGLAPGMAGVYQINVTPQGLASDRIYLRAGGKLSNIVQLPLRAGGNVSDASGTIEAVYPSPADTIGWTPHLLIVRITVRVSIGANAGPFAIAAVTEGFPSLVVAVDPASGTFEGLAPLPTMAARVGDFSNSPDLRLDLFTCQPGGFNGLPAIPFPGNILPINRIPPQELQALNALPVPDTPVAGSATGLLRVQGQARRGTTLVIDGSNNSGLSRFAAYIPLHNVCGRDQSTTMRLLVDGRQVASTELKYTATGFPFAGARP